MRILLGYVVGTGDPVYLEDGHTVITGMTQLSGKTTGLEALVERGEVVAVTFLTKRGEKGFRNQREIQPYFKEQKKMQGARKHALIDWQYVESILEATMGERMKFERSWIIKVCKGARSLEEVYANIKKEAASSTRGLDQSIYTNLGAYFEIILPEIKKYNFADKLRLSKGFNVMNLIGMANEMQQLVIESVISYVWNNLKDTVIVLPEAHKFIPQGLKTPVKQTALLFAKEGATNRNYMWIDTQETTSVDKAIIKQCSNWIMGYQQEKNEVANVRQNIGRRKITEEMIMNLKLGHFIASLHQKIYHLYILPAGIEEEIGKAVAMGKISVQEVRDGLEMRESKIIIKEPEEERKVRSEVRSELNGRFPTSQEYMKLKTELGEANTKLVEQEETYERVLQELRKEKSDLEITVENIGLDLQGAERANDELRKELEKAETIVEQLTQRMEVYSRLEHALRDLIVPMIIPLIPSAVVAEGVDRGAIANIVKEELQKMTPRARARSTSGDTGIAWVDIWLPKVGAAEEKILRFMAAKFPMKMTKSEIAIGIGLTAKGGYFSAGFNKLRKNGLLVPEGDDWKLSEGPP